MTITRCLSSFLTIRCKQQYRICSFGTNSYNNAYESKKVNGRKENERDEIQQQMKKGRQILKKQKQLKKNQKNHLNIHEKTNNGNKDQKKDIIRASKVYEQYTKKGQKKKKSSRQRQQETMKKHRGILGGIRGQTTLKNLLAFQDQHKIELRPSHISTCWNKASHFLPGERGIINKNPKIFLPLIDHTKEVIKEFNARSLAITIQSIAKISSLTRIEVDETLWKALEEEVVKIEKLEARDSSNILWAFAKVNYNSPELFSSMALKIMSNLDEFNSQDLANTVWAYATLDQQTPDLFEAVSPVAINKLETFTPQAMANTVWAYATLSHRAPDLFEAIPTIAISKLDEFNPQNMANTVWAYAKLSHEAPELFEAVSATVINKLDSFNAHYLAKIVWAFAKLDHDSPKLFEAVSARVIRKCDKLNPRDIANTLWAYATLDHDSPDLFEAVSARVINKLDTFESQDITDTVWAYATLGYDNSDLFEAIVSEVVTKLEKWNGEDIIKLVWSLALIKANTKSITPIFSHLSTQHQANRLILSEEEMYQLHQAHLWFNIEGNENCLLPKDLTDKCLSVFVSREDIAYVRNDL